MTRTQAKMRTLVALNVRDQSPATQIANQSQKGFQNVLLMIPALNEQSAIQELIVEARECGFSKILVVDGFSVDKTQEVAESAGADVRMQEFGRGKGCGVRTGMRIFLEGSYDLLCIIDGDGTNIPSDLHRLATIAEEGRADVVLGSRIRGRRNPHAMGALTYVSNLTISFLFGAKFHRLFTDVQTGYWAFTRSAVEKLYPLLQSTGFEIEMEIFVRAQREKLRVEEVPVGFRQRKGTTKFTFSLRMRNLLCAMRYLGS